MPEEENLISKKDLLARYGVSYGALYRWKRMGLLPEEWFLKKSTVTGQETFFPAALVCERVEAILAARDVTSLESLADELCRKEKRQPVLVLDTVYGVRSFRADEIRGITLLDADGNPTDLSALSEWKEK